MTTMPPEIVRELTAMEEMIEQADARRRADANMNIPVGSAISKTELGNGSSIVQTKQDSLVRTESGATLPGRTPVYSRLEHNAVHLVDTGRLMHHLSKRVGGERVFSLSPWPIDPPKVYEKTCELCLAGPHKVRKVFTEDMNGDGETKWIAHMQAFHGAQYQTIVRQEERAERQEEQALLRALMERIATGTTGPTAADVEALVAARLKEIDEEHRLAGEAPAITQAYQCQCGMSFKTSNALRLHRERSNAHKKEREQAPTVEV